MNLQEQISRMKSMMGLLIENNEYYDEILDNHSYFIVDEDGKSIGHPKTITNTLSRFALEFNKIY